MNTLKEWLNANWSFISPLSANPTKWPSTLKQFVGKLPTNYLNVFGHFVKLALKGLNHEPLIHIPSINLPLTHLSPDSLTTDPPTHRPNNHI